MDLSPGYFATIPADVRYDDNLVPNAKLLFGEITALCNKEGFCWAGNDYFADLYKVDNKTISRWISSLTKGGYLSVQILKHEGNKRKIFIGNSLRLLVTKSSLPSDKKVTTLVTKKSIASDEIVTSNIRINNTINNTMNREENALAFLEVNSPSEWENFQMRFRKEFTDTDWIKFQEVFNCKVVEESLEFTTKKIVARLTRFAVNYLENNSRSEKKNNPAQSPEPTRKLFKG